VTAAGAVAALVAVAGVLMVLWLPAVARWLDTRPWWLVAGGPAVVLGIVALIANSAGPATGAPADTAAVLVVAVAVLGGAPVATAVLRGAEWSGITGVSYPSETLEEQSPPTATGERDEDAAAANPESGGPGAGSPDAEIPLRGGLWIGALERAAVAVCLLIGQPGGLALIVAVKGLGRYPELRATGAAERFIIGTFASFLWAGAAAGVALLLR
jgi:hypothetical protein